MYICMDGWILVELHESMYVYMYISVCMYKLMGLMGISTLCKDKHVYNFKIYWHK